MMTLGWYSRELFKQDFGKMIIGYIDKLSDISDQILIKHLKEVKGFSTTKCMENIVFFKKTGIFQVLGGCLRFDQCCSKTRDVSQDFRT